jgi:Flp pilus assembly CpaF family ATPase
VAGLEAQRRAGRRLDREDERVLGRSVLDGALRAEAERRLAAGLPLLSAAEEDELARGALNDNFGSGALEQWLAEPGVTDVVANGPDRVHVFYDDGTKRAVGPIAADPESMVELIRAMAREAGFGISGAEVEVNISLPDGSRMFAALGVAPFPVLAVRRHARTELATLGELSTRGMIEAGLEALLQAMVKGKCNVLVTGGTQAGKTTLIRCMCNEIGPEERIVTVEDTYELGLHLDPERHPDVVPYLARPPNIEGAGEITMADLGRKALRSRPDRVIVGEVRGPEGLQLIRAMTQGNDGSMGTLHANSSKDAFARLASYVVADPEHRYRFEDALFLVATALDFVVHVARVRDAAGHERRVVSSIREVSGGIEGLHVTSNEIYRPGPDRRALPTGVPISPDRLERLEAAGYDPDLLERTEGWWG